MTELATNEYREYENGVADILSAIAGGQATVSRNVRLPSRSGGRKRQIDVYVEGNFLDLTDARMIVDCKRWNKAIDVTHVEAFMGLLDDVGMDVGMLVSARGASDGARKRAQFAGSVHIRAVSVSELSWWRPAGTVYNRITIATPTVPVVAKALREVGLRVMVKEEPDSGHVEIEVFRHYGTESPSSEGPAQQELTLAVLAKLSAPYRIVSQGIITQGGTPSHRWLPVHIRGGGLLKILVATEADIENQLDILVEAIGCPRSALSVERPADWPIKRSFIL